MSLLIKALEQAAKDRTAARVEPERADANVGASGPLEPTLEPAPPARAASSSSASPASEKPKPAIAERRATPDMRRLAQIDEQQQRARAATVLQAGGSSAQNVIAYLRGNPIMMLGAIAVLVGIVFGIYVYLQIAKPGLFVRQAATRPQETAPAAPPAPAAAPQPPGLPDSTAAAPATPPMAGGGEALPGALPNLRAPEAATTPSASSGTIAAPGVAPAPAPIPSTSVIAKGTSEATPATPERAPAIPRERGTIRTAPESVAPATAPAAAAPPPAPRGEASGPARERITVSAGTAQPRLNPMLGEAYALLQAGSTEEARAAYGKVVQAEPLNADALLGLAYIAAQENRSDDAMKHYLRILQLNPRHAIAQAALIGLMGRADPVASETRLKQLLAREPSPFLHFVLGNLYADQSQWAQAQQAYFQAHHLEPDNPDYAYNLAVGLDHLRQSKLALNFYRRAADLATASGRSNFNLSHARERIGILSSQLE